MAGFLDGVRHYAARGAEYVNGNAQQKQAIRDVAKSHLEEAKIYATATLVASVALAVIGTFMMGGFFGTLFGIVFMTVGVIGGVLSYDVKVACERGIPMSQNAANFRFMDTADKVEMVRRVRQTWLPMFQDTVILGAIAANALTNIEAQARQGQF